MGENLTNYVQYKTELRPQNGHHQTDLDQPGLQTAIHHSSVMSGSILDCLRRTGTALYYMIMIKQGAATQTLVHFLDSNRKTIRHFSTSTDVSPSSWQPSTTLC